MCAGGRVHISGATVAVWPTTKARGASTPAHPTPLRLLRAVHQPLHSMSVQGWPRHCPPNLHLHLWPLQHPPHLLLCLAQPLRQHRPNVHLHLWPVPPRLAPSPPAPRLQAWVPLRPAPLPAPCLRSPRNRPNLHLHLWPLQHLPQPLHFHPPHLLTGLAQPLHHPPGRALH